MTKPKYNSIAEEYDLIRPGYPEDLFAKLISSTQINAESYLLEIGAGTGKATIPLAQRDYKIDCIEIEPQMAKILMEKSRCCPNVAIYIGDFEEWVSIEPKVYDLVYCAQAFHWINDNIKYKKCYELLNTGGYLSLFWYLSLLESQDCCNLLNHVFEKYETGYACDSIGTINDFMRKEKGKLQESGYFKNISESIIEGDITVQDADLYVSRFSTTSAYASLDDKTKFQIKMELVEAIKSIGGNVVSKLLYIMFIAQKA